MGGKTRIKLQEREEKLQKVEASLAVGSTKYKKPEAPVALDASLRSFRGYFVRDPATFSFKGKSQDREKHFLHLIRHIFEKYPTPRIFDRVWLEEFRYFNLYAKNPNMGTGKRTSPKLEWLLWYVCVATGGSLYKEYMKGILTKKEVHNFLNSPPHLTVPQALFYSVAISAENNVGEASRIARSKITEKPFDDFWRNVARFFVTHPVNSSSQLNDLMDYISTRHVEDAEWSLFGAGYTVAALLKKMEEWHAGLRRVKLLGEKVWEGHPIDDQTFHTKNPDDGQVINWDFIQIKNTRDLAAEGNTMRHCVFSYKDSCIAGTTSIWSLRSRIPEKSIDKGKRRLTIRVANNGTVTEARGVGNRMPKPDEKKVLYAWAKHNHLSAASYY